MDAQAYQIAQVPLLFLINYVYYSEEPFNKTEALAQEPAIFYYQLVVMTTAALPDQRA